MEDFKGNNKRGEVSFTNHKLEFISFFNRHKNFCDEISGLKYHSLGGINEEERVLIGKDNFLLAIRSLDSFITEFIVYVYEFAKKDVIRVEFNKLESEFIKDDEYWELTKKNGNINVSDDIIFTKKYLYYLKKCFEISFLLSKYSQSSLNISTNEIVKSLDFVSYDAFFNNLNNYKKEVALVLANSSFNNLFDSFKKVFGFFYTYRYLMAIKEQNHILYLFDCIFDYMVDDDNIRNLIRLRNGNLNNDDQADLINEFVVVRKAFNMVFELVIRNLQLRNILPKPNNEVLIDNTLI